MIKTLEPPNLNLPTREVDGIEVPILDKPYTKLMAAIESGYELEMDTVHGQDIEGLTEEGGFCGTVHCIAGLAVHLCGAQGKVLEGPYAAKTLLVAERILKASSDLPRPRFFPDNYLSKEEIDDPRNSETWSEETMELVNSRALEGIRWRAADRKSDLLLQLGREYPLVPNGDSRSRQ